MHHGIHYGPRVLTAGLLIVSLGLLSGCGNSDGLVDVSGTVTMDGQPLPSALVSFYPEDGGRPSSGTTDTSGNYTLQYTDDKMGAKVGANVVRITTAPVQGEEQPEEGPGSQPAPEKIPAKYNTASELTADVPSGGSSSLDFDLTSG